MWNRIWLPAVLLFALTFGIEGCGPADFDDGDGDGVAASEDCNDEDHTIYPGADDIPYDGIDQDCDGSDLTDADRDGVDAVSVGGDDCDDADAKIRPLASEIPYDGVDQDCDGADLVDWDGDAYDAEESGGDDCDDARADVSPIGVEVCGDGVDQNCDGSDLTCDLADRDRDGVTTIDGDCDDLDSDVRPGIDEIAYNGLDDDCDALTRDDDLDEDGATRDGGGDCNDQDETVHPGADEIPYDGIDQDCSGSDLTDADLDGHDAEAAGGDDCDDTSPLRHPGIVEVPFDGTDDDCDGSDLIGAPVRVDTSSAVAQQPSITRGSSGYLVTWIDDRGGIKEVYGRLVDDAGAADGADFLIRRPSRGETLDPVAAFDGTNYLVLWREKPSGAGDEVRAQSVSDSGGLVGSGLLLASTNFGLDVRVVFGDGLFMVSWTANCAVPGSSFGKCVLARSVQSDGTLGTPNTLFASDNTAALRGIGLATDGTDFLVVWRISGLWDPVGIRGRRFSSDASALGAAFVIADRTRLEENPSVAFDGTHYLVTFEDSGNIYGQFVDTSGALVFTGSREGFSISNAGGVQSRVHVAFISGAFTTVFLDDRWGRSALYTQRVDTSDRVFGSEAFANVALYAGALDANRPWTATDGTLAFTVWDMDGGIYIARTTP